MHIVHIKDPYTSTDQVKDMRDGLAVLSVMIEVGDPNLAVKKLLDATQNLTYAGKAVMLFTDCGRVNCRLEFLSSYWLGNRGVTLSSR